jgi:NAD kinase
MGILAPRIIIVRRETEFDRVRATYSSTASARFVLERKGMSLEAIEAAHADFTEILRQVRAAIPADWRQAVVMRSEVDRFVFGPDDVVVAVGQDGLVANVAKYLEGQTVIGVDGSPGKNAGALVRFKAGDVARALPSAVAGEIGLEARVMAEARLDSGERLLALNEVFVGHRSHQSARYTVTLGKRSERQSSSGLIATTGTGLTGWASSILRANHLSLRLKPTDPHLGLLVREAWPSPATGADLTIGLVGQDPLTVTSEMDDGGVVFADGMESDHMAFAWGRTVTVGVAERRLNLAIP